MAKKRGLDAKEVGARIAQARKESGGMTQRELSVLAGVTERSIASWEAGDLIPYRYMDELESALNRSKSWLLYGGEGVPQDSVAENQARIEAKLDEALKLLRKLDRKT